MKRPNNPTVHSWRLRAAAGWIVGAVVATAASSWILIQASHEAHDRDFWSIAVPGTLTGVGTIGLSLVTVVLAYQGRLRDDLLRRQDQAAIDYQRLADRALAEEARTAETRTRARREAAKVYGALDFYSNDQPAAVIINFGDSPIFMVYLVAGAVTLVGSPAITWHTTWNPDTESRAVVSAGGKAAQEVFLVDVVNNAGIPWTNLMGRTPDSLSSYTSSLSFCWLDGDGNAWRKDGVANKPYLWTPDDRVAEIYARYGFAGGTELT